MGIVSDLLFILTSLVSVLYQDANCEHSPEPETLENR